MIHALAISWDQDYTDDNGHQWNDYRNVATSNLALGNHGWYPNPVYATAVLKTMSSSRFTVELFDRSVPSEYTEDMSGRTSSTFFQTNWHGSHVDWWTGLVANNVITTSYPACSACTCGNEPQTTQDSGSMLFKYVPMFCMYWHYLDGDDHAQFLAFKAVDILQTRASATASLVWWPGDICITAGTDGQTKNRDASSWLENFSQYAARRWVLRSYALGTLNPNNMFPTTLN